MTEFAHPDTQKADVDVNRAVRTTLNMARNEYKTVADLSTGFRRHCRQSIATPVTSTRWS